MATTTRPTPCPRSAAAQPQVICSNRRMVQLAVTYILLIVVAIIIILPLVWMLSTSIKPKAEWFTRTLEWIPKNPTFENYQNILNNPSLPIVRWFFNSAFVASATTC